MTKLFQDFTELRDALARIAADSARAIVLFEAMCDSHDALHGFAEDVRDTSPEIINHRHSDPQDEVPALIEHSYLIDLQYDAEKIVGKKFRAWPSDATVAQVLA